jgi:cytochrome b561
VVYALHAFSLLTGIIGTATIIGAFLTGWPSIIAVILNYIKQGAARGTWLLYALMLVIPISGWLMSSAKGVQTVWFGVLPLPDLLAKDKPLGEALAMVHKTLDFTLLGMVVLHSLAALKHHFVDHDDVLTRMLPARARAGSP